MSYEYKGENGRRGANVVKQILYSELLQSAQSDSKIPFMSRKHAGAIDSLAIGE